MDNNTEVKKVVRNYMQGNGSREKALRDFCRKADRETLISAEKYILDRWLYYERNKCKIWAEGKEFCRRQQKLDHGYEIIQNYI